MHKVVACPKDRDEPISDLCELHHGEASGDISPCSHFDHCERLAVIWLYTGNSPVFGMCNICYTFCYPCTTQWYRVVKVLPEFTGKL